MNYVEFRTSATVLSPLIPVASRTFMRGQRVRLSGTDYVVMVDSETRVAQRVVRGGVGSTGFIRSVVVVPADSYPRAAAEVSFEWPAPTGERVSRNGPIVHEGPRRGAAVCG